MLQSAYERLDQQAAELEQREREVVQAHAAGERSTAQLVQTLLRNHNEARVLSSQVEDLEERAVRVPEYSLPSGRATKKIFDFHQTSLRASLWRLSNTPTYRDHQDVVVSTSQNRYSLSMVEGGRYMTETTRFDNRDEVAPDRFEDREAYERTLELYPWADENGKPYFQDNSPDHYWTGFVHDQGRTEVYLDGGTGDVCREVQVLTASSLPLTEVEVGPWNKNGLNMTMNKTAKTGPVEVRVTDQDTKESVDATVTFAGVEVGRTGDDGTLWVIPLIGSHELEAKTEPSPRR